jgi:hypothetical protein
MKKYYLFASLVLLAASPAFAQTKIGGAGAPDGSAMLEVTSGASNNKGLLLPKMTTVQRNAITSPATGLMIYNTTTNETQVNTGTPALPVWAASTATATGWNTIGNTGTTPATNFIGTTDNQPLTLRTNNTEKVRVTAAGDVGIGTNAPAAKLHVDTGGLMITNGTTALANPAIQVVNNGGGPGNNDNIVINSFGTNTQPSIGTQSSRGTFSSPQNSQAGDNIGNFFFNSRVNGSVANSNVIRGVYLGDGTTNKSRLNFFTSNAAQMTIDSSGFVGIGTTTPAAKLQVNAGGITVSNNAPMSSSAINVISDNGGGVSPDNISITTYGLSNAVFGVSSARGTAAAPQNSQAGDNTGNVWFAPRINGAFSEITRINSVYLGDGTTSKSRMGIYTSNALAVSIDSSGYVGIGIAAPQQDLHVQGTARITGSSGTATTIAGRNAAGDVSNIAVGAGLSLTGGTLTATAGGNNWGLTGNTGTTPATNFIGTTDNQPLSVRTNNTEAMRITAAGRVGIGTATPAVNVQIVDTGNVSLRVGTNIIGNKSSVNLGSANNLHGISLGLASYGGTNNDIALHTASSGITPGSIYLAASPTAIDSLNLNQFVLKNTGNVGIGIKDPTAKLHVNTGGLRITNATTALTNPAIEVINDGGGVGNNDNIVINSFGTNTRPSIGTQSSRGTFSAPQNSQAGDNIGNFFFNARVNGTMTNGNVMRGTYLGNGTTNKSRLEFLTSATTAMTIDSSGNVGIGVTSPKVKLQVQGGLVLRNDVNIAHGNGTFITWSTVRSGIGETEFINYRGTGTGGFRFYDVNPGGSVDTAVDIPALSGGNQIAFIAPGTGAYSALSDIRVKTNVNIINDGLEKVMAIRPVSYDLHTERTLKDGVVTFNKNDQTIKTIGFVAQELAKVVPEAVIVPKDPANEFYTVSYSIMIPVLTKAIQEQQKQIEALQAENQKLKNTEAVTAQLMERVKQMEQMMGVKEIEGTSKVAGK